jgi:hypothetical protein
MKENIRSKSSLGGCLLYRVKEGCGVFEYYWCE